MVGLNKMLVIGNVGTDPDMRYTPNGNPVTSFRLATGRTYTTSDGERRPGHRMVHRGGVESVD
jgi:single-strand DNA-binding protein